MITLAIATLADTEIPWRKPRYDLPSFFNYFDFINVSKFAEYVGINESKMRAYKSGVSYPGEKTTSKIFKAVKQLGKEFSVVIFR